MIYFRSTFSQCFGMPGSVFFVCFASFNLRIILIRKYFNVCFYRKQDVNFVICSCAQLLLIDLGPHCPDLSQSKVTLNQRPLHTWSFQAGPYIAWETNWSFHKWCHFGKGVESFHLTKCIQCCKVFWRLNQNIFNPVPFCEIREKHTTYNNIRELYILNN